MEKVNLTHLMEKVHQQEKIVEQLVKIVAVTNDRVVQLQNKQKNIEKVISMK